MIGAGVLLQLCCDYGMSDRPQQPSSPTSQAWCKQPPASAGTGAQAPLRRLADEMPRVAAPRGPRTGRKKVPFGGKQQLRPFGAAARGPGQGWDVISHVPGDIHGLQL